MSVIFETPNFEVVAAGAPLVSREEGGHIIVFAKDASIGDRTRLSPKQAIEFARLIMLAGEGFATAMNNVGVPVVRINYADYGNGFYRTGEKPLLHCHIMGRIWGARKQVFPNPPYMSRSCPPGREFFDDFAPLAEADVAEVAKQMKLLEGTDKYRPIAWGLAPAGKSR